MKKYLRYSSPCGVLTIVAGERGLAGVYFPSHHPQPENFRCELDVADPILCRAVTQLDAYFAGQGFVFDLPIDCLQGTAFQREVWEALQSIPYGATMSYADLAKKIGRPAAVRAVGAANGRNPLSIIIPCHRVIASSGKLQGYAGGIDNKEYLLTLEQKHSQTRN
ncbi:methylated-DNA--[protein]-cysteine S-methyltransferase [Undibacterium fentianense]|uniref:Methylated-DNA--protein-cysteine methyltransferase n=1 Tax=Undibacterium fentianense TaxID=2828728 RepID=A0A941IFR4_9BURK|nr:methylated-DNA--[protein]-cysteine S-methyltransferase [Undibacterium fentianense]MBR7800627.1 methylated-DNA--[protein]-cysteine S-methyltransferase [Undibacterium fentianense]